MLEYIRKKCTNYNNRRCIFLNPNNDYNEKIENKKLNNSKNYEKYEEIEDFTKYGEFVSSYFAWLTPEKQKKRAKEIDDMTKK